MRVSPDVVRGKVVVRVGVKGANGWREGRRKQASKKEKRREMKGTK
jgi:hypothetical protein